MTIQVITVPDLGGAENVDVIEVCIAPGDSVEPEQSLLVLETDKASMEVPCPEAGTIVSVKVNEGDTVSEGDAIIELDMGGAAAAPEAAADAPASVEAPSASEAPSANEEPSAGEETPAEPAAASAAAEMPIVIPDLGGAENVDVIEVCVAVGDDISEGDSLIVLETDKASMEIPAPASGQVLALSVNEGDKVSEGDSIGTLKSETAQSAAPAPAAAEAPKPAAAAPAPTAAPVTAPTPAVESATQAPKGTGVYAGPAVRKLARQLGVDLSDVKGTGPRGRLVKDDVRTYVKQVIAEKDERKVTGGSGIPPIPEVDFSKFGPVEMVKMTKIKKVTAANMSRNWLNVPHVTQWDDADITELEAFRKDMKAEAEKRGTKLTPLPFLLKACAAALRAEPSFNVSLHADGEHVVQKDYVHIGIAADTPAGLVVPVLRDVDKKGIWQIAEEVSELIKKARDGKLMPKDMQGACFTVSSLGAMGGNGFTPIVNAPEVAILGVSRAQVKPVWDGSEFIPRNMLPLSLSYDHRAINGADCGRFFTYLVSAIADIRRLLL